MEAADCRQWKIDESARQSRCHLQRQQIDRRMRTRERSPRWKELDEELKLEGPRWTLQELLLLTNVLIE